MNFVKKMFIVTLILMISMLSYSKFASASDDVTGHWHEEALRLMIEKQIMKGYGDGVYKPNGSVTRGQFSVILTRALSLPLPEESIGFSDVNENTGMMDEILSAASANIVKGYPDGTFKPNNLITRQHMAVMVKRALDYLFIEDQSNNLLFKDNDLIIGEYRNAIDNAVYYGIFKGSQKEDGLYFRPNDNATRGDAAAITKRLLEVIEENSQTTPEPEPKLTFDIATINSASEITVIKKYDTYDAAIKNLSSNQIIMYGNSILKMSNGIVVTVPTINQSITEIYSTPELKGNGFTYVPANTELQYVKSTDTYVEVKIAGVTGFIRHENSQLKPEHTIENRSYYKVTSGILSHYIYSHATNRYANYSIGNAPTFLNEGTKYLSWDGVHFETMTGTEVGKSYSYFQFMPARTVSQYTAEEIDAYILTMLQQLEQAYPNDKTYNQASTQSKLRDLGTYLKQIESEKKINALFILALAQHESAYGLSTYALEHNNLFGTNVTDDDPSDFSFTTVQENIDAFVDQFMNKNYIPPNAAYANGAVFGNKAIGANVKYASDPYWGAKAGGHWYRIDKAMGGRELANPYIIGMTNIAGLNVRTEPKVSLDNRAFRYLKGNLPVIINGELPLTNGYEWYRVISDDILFDELYIAKEYIDILPVK